MAEATIKRTNFFDGQFLKQGEFLGMEDYHRHMRRRMLWVLFDRSGVIQLGGSDLTLEIASAATQRIRVRAGTAIGKRDDLVEAKEIVVREDVELDLNAVPLAAGDTGIVTVHYAELQTDPSSEGGTLGNTRVTEQAILTVHRNTMPGPTAPNGEPYVRLGNVAYTGLGFTPPRDTAYVRAALMAPTASINISPNAVIPGTTLTLAVTGSNINLSTLAVGNIAAMAGVTINSVTNQTPTSADVNITVAAGATPGGRTFNVTIPPGATTPLTVEPGLQVTSFTGVNTPADTTIEINGSGFLAPVTVEFPLAAGGVASVAVLTANITATQLRIPMADILDTIGRGPVRVVSAGRDVTSAFDVVPPAKFDSVYGRNAAGTNTPNAVRRNNILRIEGRRFYSTAASPISIRLGGYTTPATFPNVALGESRSDTFIELFVPSASVPNGAHELTVTTAGGSVRHTTTINATPP